MKLAAHPIGLGALILQIGVGCACDGQRFDDDPAKPPVDAGADTMPPPADAGDDVEAGLPTPDASPPPGWHRWPFPPNDCTIFVPDDLGTVEPLPWEPCPYQPDGCTRAGAPWAQANGWAYASGIMGATIGGDTFFLIARQAADQWWESLYFKNDVLIGSWRWKTWGNGGLCNASGPVLFAGKANMVLIRAQAESSPWLFSTSPGQIFADPGTPQVFGPPDSALLPGGHGFQTSKIALLREYYGGFVVRDLTTGAFQRPQPGSMPYVQLTPATPVEDRSFYGAWTGALNSVWVHSMASGSQPLLKDDFHSYDRFETDGTDFVWIRSSGHLGGQQFETVELWTAPVAFTAATLQPKMLLTLPVAGPANLAVGEGWVAARLDEGDTRLYRLSDGLEKRLPVVDGVAWSGGQFEGLAIAGGQVFVQTYTIGGAGNDPPFITRFDIDKLPTP